MVGVTVMAVFRPKPDCEAALDAVIRDHQPILREQGLVTDYPPTVLKATDGTVIEIFEWVSEAAIDGAHLNPAVTALWERFNAVCDYLPIADVPEAKEMFSPFRRYRP